MPAEKGQPVEQIWKNSKDTQALVLTLLQHSDKPMDTYDQFLEAFYKKASDGAKERYDAKQIRSKATGILRSVADARRDPKKRQRMRISQKVMDKLGDVSVPRNAPEGSIDWNWINSQVG